MTPRPYQIKALDAIWTALQCEKNVLLEAACGAGKTMIFSKIIKRLLAENSAFRVLILMDREILVRQTEEKLRQVAPELAFEIGIACASVSVDRTHGKRVTIASRQTLINMLDTMEPVQLCVVDEAHLLPIPKEGQEAKEQYPVILDRLLLYNPRMRILGVTATPYRLNDGYIYGEKNSPGCMPYFSDVHHKISVAELQAEGFLAPLVGKTIKSASLEEQIGSASIVAGEYHLGQISEIMSQGIHIQSAVEAWKEHANDRKKTIVFCVTIEHAEALTAAFNAAGIPSIAIHSQQSSLWAYASMEALKNGSYRVYCSVAKLTTGMDVVDIDCTIMARPTKSAALYKQCLGRGARTSPGKADCMVLDLVGNNAEFGTNLDNLKIKYHVAMGADGKPTVKSCPQCEADLHPAVRTCPECGFEFPRDTFEAEKPEMVGINYGTSPPVTMPVAAMYPSVHTSKTSKKSLLKLRIELKDLDSFKTISGNMWLCFPGDGYVGYAVQKCRELWEQITENDRYFPNTAAEALAYEHFYTPESAIVDLNGKYPEIKQLVYEELPF